MTNLAKSVLKKLDDAIKNGKSGKVINDYEEILSENIQYLSKTPSFYSSPIKNVINIISKGNYESLDDAYKIIQDL